MALKPFYFQSHSFISTVFLIVVGLIVYGCRVNSRPPPYTTTLLVCGALMAALGGISATLELTGTTTL